MTPIIWYTHITRYFLIDVRANQCGRAWVPWSIIHFRNTIALVYFICIIPSDLHIYSLFSNRCSGEPVWPCVSSLKYRFNLEILYTLYALHDTYHLIYAYYSLFSNRCSGEPVWPCVSSLKYRFNLEILYTLYALHDTYHLIYAYYSLFSNRCSGEPVWPCVSSLKYRFILEIL